MRQQLIYTCPLTTLAWLAVYLETMASVGTVDPKGLEGRQEGESTAPRSRDFFWDSVVLFVVTAIVALTAIDVVAEFIRGSVIQCFLPNDTSNLEAVQDYVNEICAGSLPRTEYLPAYITIHAILILAPHYLWLNMFGANLDFFFQHVSQLVRTRDEKTGEYAKKNYIISEQLENAFNRSNWMYYLYLLKLAFQFAVSVVGFGLVLGCFNDYREVFPCPANDNELESEYWPLQNQTVRCVFTSLRLLGSINVVYLVLLALAIVCLFVAFIWCIKLHISELAVENQAIFCFQTSIPLNHYTPQLPVSRICPGLGNIAYGLLSYLPYISLRSPYNIRSDYDFLVIKLFRTDGGLAHILREVHALRLLKEKNDEEYARINIFRRQMPYKGKKGGIYNMHVDTSITDKDCLIFLLRAC